MLFSLFIAQGMANYKRQATSSAAYASPSQALAASVKANANIAAIIVGRENYLIPLVNVCSD